MKVAHSFERYQLWMNRQNANKNVGLKRYKIFNLMQIIINLFIVMGIFFTCAYIETTPWGDFILLMSNLHIQKAILWALALIVSLPFLIAAYSKIKFLCALLTELNIKDDKADLQLKWHKIIAELIPLFSLISIMLFICALSISILPPLELLIIISIVAFILIALLYTWFIKLHSRLKDVFLETFEKEEIDRSDDHGNK
jgi:CPA2 family monovalent cation:H+ antiporter-2